jgi:hypothetical protein
MKYYFSLQYRMLNRQISDLGLNPFLGYGLAIAAFTGLSILLFDKTEFAAYIFLVTALSLVTKLSEVKRNDFLRSCFSEDQYLLVRIAENIVIIFPFAVFLLLNLMVLQALLLLALSAFLALTGFSRKSGFIIPTPFGKKPFEFTVGFRNAFMLFVLAYFLAFMSVAVGNFNLGIFALLLIFLVCITFYLNPEDEFYVWIFDLSPPRFLFRKISTALLYSTVITLPIGVVLMIFFPADILAVTGFLALGYIYLATIILAKYSSYPNQVNLPQFIILALTIWFPPALIAVAPYFYLQSIKRLKPILE